MLSDRPRLLGSFYKSGNQRFRSRHVTFCRTHLMVWGRWVLLHHFCRKAVWGEILGLKKLEKRMRFCLFLCSSFFLGHFHVIGFNLSVLMFKLYGTFFFFINQMILHSEKNSIWHIVCVSQCQWRSIYFQIGNLKIDWFRCVSIISFHLMLSKVLLCDIFSFWCYVIKVLGTFHHDL